MGQDRRRNPSAQSHLSEAAREMVGVDKASIPELETFLRRQGTSIEANTRGLGWWSLKKTAGGRGCSTESARTRT